MASYTTICRQCGADCIALQLRGAYAIVENELALFCECPRCDLPSTFHIRSSDIAPNQIGSVISTNFDLSAIQHRVIACWPERKLLTIPFVPEKVSKAYRQAEDNFPRIGNEDAAAVMFRRTLELALQEKFGRKVQNLKSEIDKLVKSGDLIPSIGEWAHEVRLIGNEAAHQEDGVDRESLTDLRNITEIILRNLFMLPGLIEERRKRRESQ